MPRAADGSQMRFADFWIRYLDAHRKPATRGAHYVATLIGIGTTLAAIQTGQIAYLIAGLMVSVGIAVGSHWLIEGNQPLIRVNAFYGALADIRMCWLALIGGLGTEYKRHGLLPRADRKPKPAASPPGCR